MICSYWAHAYSQRSLLFSVLINPSRWWDNMRKSPHTHTLPSTSMTQRNVSNTFCQQLGPNSHLTLSLLENRAIHQLLSPFCECLKWVSEVAQLCPTVCDPMDCSLPGSSVHGILQARILEWVTISFSRGSSSWPRDRTRLHAMISLTILILAQCLIQVSYFSTLELKEMVQSADRTNLQKLSSSSLPLESPDLLK